MTLQSAPVSTSTFNLWTWDVAVVDIQSGLMCSLSIAFKLYKVLKLYTDVTSSSSSSSSSSPSSSSLCTGCRLLILLVLSWQHTFSKCPFIWHLLQYLSLAGHSERLHNLDLPHHLHLPEMSTERKKKSLKIADYLPRLALRAEVPSWDLRGAVSPPNFFDIFNCSKEFWGIW